MDIFCSKHSNCEESISVIAEILANNNNEKYKQILNKFKLLNFNKVKDLAKATLGKASLMTLDGDPLAKLYEAIQIYDQRCADQLKMAMSEYQLGNFIKTREMCEIMYMHQPSDIKVLKLLADSCFKCEEYDKSILYLNKLSSLIPNSAIVYNNMGSNYMMKSQYYEALDYYYKTLSLQPDNYDVWTNFTNILVKINNTEATDNIFQTIILHNPKLYMARNHYGKFLLSLNKIKDAKEQFKIAKKISPDLPDSWNNLGDLYHDNSKIEKGINCYKQALIINPHLITTWINIGRSYFKLEKYQNAMETFQNILKQYPDNVSALEHLAIVYYYQNDIPLAIETYKQCLEFQPNNIDYNLKLGILYFQSENNQESEKYFKICFKLNPQIKIEVIYNHISIVYQLLGKYKDASNISILLGDLYFDKNNHENARSLYLYAAFLNPDNYYVHWKLGLALYKMELLDLALISYGKAKELYPDFPNVYCDCAIIYEAQNLHERAIIYYEMTLRLDPNHFNALHNLLILKQKLGLFSDVVTLYKKMLEHENSDDFDVHIELGNIFYREMGNLQEAYNHFKKALEMNSTFLDLYLNIGNLLIKMKNSECALNYFNEAITLDPQCIIAHTNVGSIHKNKGKFIEAIDSFERALKIIPYYPNAYCNLVQCLQQICNWLDYDSRITRLICIVNEQLENDLVPSLLPDYSLLYPFSPKVLKQIATKYADQSSCNSQLVRKLCQKYVHQTFLSSNGCIRVGYVSSDFCNNHISKLMQTISCFHNKNFIEVFFYSLSPDDSFSSWSKIFTETDHLKDISKYTVANAANQINNDGIHILINMNGYMNGTQNEIFALRPAPIQVLWLGYPGTSGASFIDYLITDEICTPLENKHFYSEKLVYINQSVFVGEHMFGDLIPSIESKTESMHQQINSIYLTNNGNISTKNNYFNELVPFTTTSMNSVTKLPDNSVKYTRQMYNLPEECIIYCNFSQLYKIEPFTFSMWATILKRVKNSVLWLLRLPDAGEENIHAYAATLNIDVSRIIFSTLESKVERIKIIQLADVFLDTFMWNGNTTCLDALWAGIPVVTLPGETLASRITASQLTTLGYTKTIAHSGDDYIRIAVHFGLDKMLLETTKITILQLKTESKLFNCKSYAKELENAYNYMWNKYLSDNQEHEP